MDVDNQDGLTIDDAVDALFQEEEPDNEVETDEGEQEEEPDEEPEGVEEADEDGEEEEGADEEEGTEEDDDEPDDDDSEVGSEEGDDDDDAPTLASDDAEVEVTVGDQTQKVKVSELKRLAGQEKNLTQKSQAVAEQQRNIESQNLAVAKILEDRFNAAQERVNKYKDVDLYKASRELDEDDFEALRSAKEGADAELAQIQTESREFVENAQKARKEHLRQEAQKSRQIIQERIPEWSDELYGQLRSYAVNQGMDQGTVNELVDPAAIVMISKAMKYDEAANKGAETVNKKVKKAPKKVAKKSGKATNTKGRKANAARKQAAQSGDLDDVLNAFIADQED